MTRSTVQCLADHLDQLDLALDQLALNDRNFDRFAFMLIDNVMELVLHEHAVSQSHTQRRTRSETESSEAKAVVDALGPRFHSKVKLAKATKYISFQEAKSIGHLHGFRNTAYHQGLRHDGVLHSLAAFYLRMASDVLARNKLTGWSRGGGEPLPHRALKYLGTLGNFDDIGAKFQAAWRRLHEVAESIPHDLKHDLHRDMAELISGVNGTLEFLEEDDPRRSTRDQIIRDVQLARLAMLEKTVIFARERGCDAKHFGEYRSWLELNYPLPIPCDPIEGWKARLSSLHAEPDEHGALDKYCQFQQQTKSFCEDLSHAAGQLDAHIQNQIDEARGK